MQKRNTETTELRHTKIPKGKLYPESLVRIQITV